MTTATGYSFPSGHTMNASSAFGGGIVRKDFPAALRIGLGIVLTLIAFSRLFVGVHTPQDVLVGIAAGLFMMWLTVKLMQWIAANPGKDLLVAAIGILLAALLALYAGTKPYPTDFDAEGKLLVDGAKMANDTFKGVCWCIAFLIGWILERRYVGFSTDVSLEKKLTRLIIGMLCYYAVSLILVPLIKGWIGGPAGTVVSCFVQVFFITFIFPWFVKHFEKSEEI